ELMELTDQFKREHQYLTYLFESFAETAGNLIGAKDIASEVARIKLLGEAFTEQFRRHMAIEETELAGFL
ncbi:MAG TPA: hypothetical protein VLV89_11555, partial [Candidatus Acidoferrum sp.]|nr:hypothetical protein [Candidatus Acidoferrum sp.]